jgi:hypothetical protein
MKGYQFDFENIVFEGGGVKMAGHVGAIKVMCMCYNFLSLYTKTKKYEHITPVLKSLHWLPVHLWIKFKILLLCYRILNDLAPSYLAELLTSYSPTRSLRSSSKSLLLVPKTRLKTYGDRAFSSAAPALWNTLPDHVKHAKSTSAFKCGLKTHLFKEY